MPALSICLLLLFCVSVNVNYMKSSGINVKLMEFCQLCKIIRPKIGDKMSVQKSYASDMLCNEQEVSQTGSVK